MKYYNLLICITLSIPLALGCKKDDSPEPIREIQDQTPEDDKSLVKYLKTHFYNYEDFENDSAAVLQYQTNQDLAQSTAHQQLTDNLGNGADESMSGTLQLFNPSSTTFVKHFISRTSGYYEGDANFDYYIAGYANTTSAINAVQFQMQDDSNNARGDLDDGIIKLYGVS